MALPVLDKTWQIDPSNAEGGSGTVLTDHRQTLFRMKADLVTFPALGAWTVRGSSDGAGAGAMDAVDRWAAPANVIWANAGTNHSWIVLRQTGVATNYELCIDCAPLLGSTQGPLLAVVCSPSLGFGGGGPTARPTAADEIVLLNGARWIGTNAATPSFATRVHAWVSSDGQASRLVVHFNGVPLAFWLFDRAQDPVSGWTNPSVSIVLGAADLNDSVLTYDKLWAAAAGRGLVGGVSSTIYLATESYGGQAAGQRAIWPHGLTGEWDIYDLACRSETEIVSRGRLTGVTPNSRGLWDLFAGSKAVGRPWHTFPVGAGRTFVQFHDFVFPWDGSIPATT